jgi:hypothetical protein
VVGSEFKNETKDGVSLVVIVVWRVCMVKKLRSSSPSF